MAGNHTVIKRYSDNYYCVMQLKGAKSEGVSKLSKNIFDDEETKKLKHDHKLEESLVRSRTKIFELAMSNDFEMFATFTIDPKKYDRYNLKQYYKDFSQYIKDLNKRHGMNIQYLLIPETHVDGAWHMHGLLKGLPPTRLQLFSLDKKLPDYIRDKLKAGQKVYDWLSYRCRFGFCDLEPIRNKEACCKYILKYITKDISRSVKEAHARVYYASRSLAKPEIVFSGEMTDIITLPDFENCYVMKKDFFDLASALDFKTVKFFDSFVSAGFDDDTIEKILAM